MKHCYERYIPLIFDNDGSRGTDQYFKRDIEAEPNKLELELLQNPELVLDVLHATFTNIERHLSKYTGFQLSNALNCIFDTGLSDYGFVLRDKDTDQEKRFETLHALSDLILYIFEDTAEPVLGHLNQKPENKLKHHLNGVCYMFWDIACIPHGCDRECIDICLEVMGKCARSSNIAVVEGALHGLGHARGLADHNTIQRYIRKANFGNGPESDALRRYAKAANLDLIQ
ncbi:MAG: hypothetical protein JKY49_02885 [Cohaesibacteraceae bacterium]|nr:hypothetical protein [Cohaesibacteraceae bacterium]